jgi:hypothetical protein
MPIVKAGILYFALVFGAGFVLGPIRVFWVVPHLGERTAELMAKSSKNCMFPKPQASLATPPASYGAEDAVKRP